MGVSQNVLYSSFKPKKKLKRILKENKKPFFHQPYQESCIWNRRFKYMCLKAALLCTHGMHVVDASSCFIPKAQRMNLHSALFLPCHSVSLLMFYKYKLIAGIVYLKDWHRFNQRFLESFILLSVVEKPHYPQVRPPRNTLHWNSPNDPQLRSGEPVCQRAKCLQELTQHMKD